MNSSTSKDGLNIKEKHFHEPLVETTIQRKLEEYYGACRQGDIYEIMSFFAPDVVAYDMPPPLRYAERESYKGSLEKWFTSQFEFPITYEMTEQKVFASGDLAFVHGLTYMSGTFKKSGETVSCWTRHTMGFRKLHDQWKIVHEHTSVPVAEDGRALMDLKPEANAPDGEKYSS